MRLLLMGPPGAGKGTQAARLAKQFEIPHIATGDMFRQALREKTPMGMKAQAYMDRGDLVPDEVVVGLVDERFRQPDLVNGYVLDGFPRTKMQAESFQAIAMTRGESLNRVLYVKVDDSHILRRISGRRSCSNNSCGRIYHVEFHPPKVPDTCDHCGSSLFQRTDDKEETVRGRLETYHRETAPLIEFYREEELLTEVDGVGSVDEVTERLNTAIKASQTT